VFVVGCLGDWERAAQVLFERESVQRDSSSRRAPREGTAGNAEDSVGNGGWMPNNPGVVSSVCTKWSKGTGGPSGSEHFNLVAQPVAFPIDTQNMTEGHSSGGLGFGQSGDPSFTVTKGHSHAVAHAFYSTGGTHGVNQHPEVSPAVKVGSGLGIPSPPAVAFQQNQLGEVRCGNIAGTVNTNSNASGRNTPMAMQAMTVRRLTPRECERLQGFPDDYTLIPWRKKQAEDCPDGPRYKALGNSMAVNCMAWIGERIAALENNR
jgi:DNA (cytosine-5)-methyltransferase 1